MYLGISIPPISLSLRCTLECLLAGEDAAYDARRHYLSTILPILAALGIALTCPQVRQTTRRLQLAMSHRAAETDMASIPSISWQASEKIFAITGATAVMLICYLIPVALHLMLREQIGRGESSELGEASYD